MVYQVPTPCFPKKDSGYGFNKKIRFQAHPDGTWYGLWTGLENPLWFEGNLGSEFIFTLCLSDIKNFIVGGRVICFMVFDTFHILMAIMIYAISGCPWVLVKATLADFFPIKYEAIVVIATSNEPYIRWLSQRLLFQLSALSFFQLLITFSIKRNCM